LGSVGGLWYWFALLFYFPSSDSVFQPLEERNKFLELLRDIAREEKSILDIILQATHEGGTICVVVI
jgi:hypothetical protein